MLTLDQVSFKYQDQWLLKKTSLTITPNTLTVIVGPNGAGKTTLLRLLAKIKSPTTGQIFFKNDNLQQYSRRALARHITFVPQRVTIHPAFTVKTVVMMGRYAHLKRFQREQSQDYLCVHRAMQQTDILHLANRLITTLSDGEQRRVLIARSLASEAEVILLDEPVANLDIAHTLDILQLCQQLVNVGKTMILVLHDLNLALRYAEHVIVMDEGHVVGNGLPSEVLTESLLTAVFRVKSTLLTSANDSFLVLTRCDL